MALYFILIVLIIIEVCVIFAFTKREKRRRRVKELLGGGRVRLLCLVSETGEVVSKYCDCLLFIKISVVYLIINKICELCFSHFSLRERFRK